MILNTRFSWILRAGIIAVLVVLLLPHVKGPVESGGKALYSLYLFLCSFLLAFVIMPFAITLGFKLRILDHPDEERKQHARPTPLTGGAAIYAAFATIILFNFHFSIEMKAILVASTFILLLGLVDDKWRLSARFRIIVQLAAALFLVYSGVRVTFVPNWLGGVYVETFITLVWIIGITNSMNFIDGMDGLAAGTAIIYSVFFALIALVTHQMYMMYLAITIAGSCLGFFIYNFRREGPALIFLGDSGATFIGFLLASFAILGEWGTSIIDIVVPVIIMSVLIFDMVLTTIVRIRTGEVKTLGEWLHYTGRDHFHHRLEGLGISRKKAALLFFCVSISFGLEAVVLLFSNILISVIILVHSILVFAIIGIILVLRNREQNNGNVAVEP